MRLGAAGVREHVIWLLALVAILSVLGWARQIHAGYLAAGLITLSTAAVLRWRAPGGRGRRLFQGSLLLCALGIGIGAWTQVRFGRIENSWSELVAERDAQYAHLLERRMASEVERGRAAAVLAAASAAQSRSRDIFEALTDLRAQTQIDAIAVFSDDGDLVAWSGTHRGRLPQQIRVDSAGAYFTERPLFSYLYFAAPVPGSSQHAVAAIMLESGLVLETEDLSFTASFMQRTGVRPIFRQGGGAGAVWALVEGVDTIVHARLQPTTQAAWRTSVEEAGQRAGTLAALTAFVLLAAGWLRLHQRYGGWRTMAPLVAAIVLLALAPLDAAFGLERIYSPLLFVLPFRGDITLGLLMALLIPFGALASSIRMRPVSPTRFALALGLGSVAVGLAYVAGLRMLLDAATAQLLENNTLLWLCMQTAALMLLTSITILAMPRQSPLHAVSTRMWDERRAELVVLLVAAGLTLVLGAVVVARTFPANPPPTWTAALWVAPFILIAAALSRLGGAGGRAFRWLAAGWVAASAIIPHLWVGHVGARLDTAEQEVSSLGARSDPYLDYLLLQFGRDATARYAAGEDGVQLLYRAWVASGMAQESYPVQAAVWSDAGEPLVQLGLGDAQSPDSISQDVRDAVIRARRDSDIETTSLSNTSSVSRLLTVPLSGGGVISVAVPPRRTLERTSVVAPFLGAVPNPSTQLNLVPTRSQEIAPGETLWTRSAAGWRSDTRVQFPEGEYHAHLEVQLPSMGVRFARGVLLLVLDLILLGALWVLGAAARGVAPRPRHGWTGWLGSFRARVTIALFTFFLLPTAVFGWVAYSALAGEVARAARAVALRAVELAVLEFPDANGDLRELAAHAGTDVLYFYRGELAEVSSPEALALGAYDAWMPPSVFAALSSGEESSAVEMRSIGDRPFLTAFRTLPPTGTLAVPMALSAGDTAVRQRELAHLVLFAALLGGLLSLALSVVVGRALTGPMAQLRRAAAAVGAGRLRVRLPEPAPGEFNQLFASFNRMTRRLRRARAQELRSARVLAWGEMARQIAHEIKNPLTPIKLAVQHVRRAYNDRRPDFGDILEDSVSQILVEIDRLTEIARAFSRYGAPGELAGPIGAVDVAGVAREAITLYRTGDTTIEYVEEIDPTVPLAYARSGELKEVVLNLLDNARNALEGSAGRIEVATYVTGDRIGLDVIDNGPGIPADLLPRIFEPHFSTRSAGTGLGLAIVRRIVESWGGTVTAESEPGRGTVIRVRMLIADSAQRMR